MAFIQQDLFGAKKLYASLEICTKTYPIAEEKSALVLQESADILAQAHEKQGNYKLAYQYHKTFKVLSDSLLGEVNRIADVVKSLQTFTQSDENTAKETNIHDNLEAVLVILGNRFMGKIELVKEFAPVLSPIWCFPAQISQVFLSLLINSEEALEGSGKITLQTSENEKFVIISVRDNGRGIPQKIQSSIFHPFFSTKESDKNTGLGLSMAQEIIQDHHGKIELISQEGRGTEFLIYLPKSA